MTNGIGQNQGGQPSVTERLHQQANIAAFVVGIFAAFGEVTFFRTRFGERYFQGVKTGLVVPVLLLFPIFWPHEDPAPLWVCLVLYGSMCIKHRWSIARRRARGETGIHSLYNGQSRLERRWPRVSEERLKSRHEPVVMLGMGLAALIISSPLGWFFIWCAAGMALQANLLSSHQRQRSLDLADARIEGQLLTGESGEPPQSATSAPSEIVCVHRSNHA